MSLDCACSRCYNERMGPNEIKKLREFLEMTQEKFAQAIGANRVTVAKWETGDHAPLGLYRKALLALAEKAKRSRRSRGK